MKPTTKELPRSRIALMIHITRRKRYKEMYLKILIEDFRTGDKDSGFVPGEETKNKTTIRNEISEKKA